MHVKCTCLNVCVQYQGIKWRHNFVQEENHYQIEDHICIKDFSNFLSSAQTKDRLPICTVTRLGVLPNQTEALIADIKSSQEEADLYLYHSYTQVCRNAQIWNQCAYLILRHRCIRPRIISYATQLSLQEVVDIYILCQYTMHVTRIVSMHWKASTHLLVVISLVVYIWQKQICLVKYIQYS